MRTAYVLINLFMTGMSAIAYCNTFSDEEPVGNVWGIVLMAVFISNVCYVVFS